MKKILIYALMFLVLLSSMQGSAYLSVRAEDDIEEITENVSETEEAEILPEFVSECAFLEKIGVLPEDYDATEEITREEYAYIIAKLLYYNISYEEYPDMEMFEDISDSDYYDEINILKSLKIISGYGNEFRPYNAVSYVDAVSIIIKALSYEQYADALGRYPTGYLYLAKQLGLSKGIENQSGSLRFDTAVKVVYNALFMDTVNVDSISNGEISYSINNGKNVLSQYLGIRQLDAILINNGISSFDGAELYNENKVVVRDFKTGEEFILTVSDDKIHNYFGCRLNLFTHENENKEEEIIVYEPDKRVNVTEICGEKIINFNDSSVEYEINEDSAKTGKLSLSNPLNVFINGVKIIDYTSSEFKDENSMIEFIDNDNDKKIDVINILRYDYSIVVNNISNNYITDKSEAGNNLDLGDEEARFKIIKSEVTELKNIRANDVISVAKSSRKIAGKDLYYITVTRAVANGMLEAKGEDEVVINGVSYKLAESVKNKLSKLEFENIKTNLDIFGRIVFIDQSGASRSYAFVLGAGLTGNAIDPVGVVKLFTGEGKTETYNLAEKVEMNNEPLPSGFGVRELVAKIKSTTDDLVAYSLNNNGEIENIMFAQPFDTDEKNNQDKFVYVKSSSATATAYSGYSFGGVSIDGAVCFNISSYYDNTGKGCEVFTLSGSQYYANVKFYDLEYDGTVGAALLKGASSQGSFLTAPKDVYVFDKLTSCITKDGAPAKKLYYYSRGKKGSVVVDPDAVSLPLTTYACEKVTDMKFGDIFTFETNIDGYLSNFCRLYQHDPLNPIEEDGEIYRAEYGGTGTAKEILIMQGTLRYKASDKIVLSQYGPELSLQPFSRSGGEKAYIINLTEGKIKLVPLDQLKAQDFNSNTQGDSIIVQASRHQLKEVIIYE